MSFSGNLLTESKQGHLPEKYKIEQLLHKIAFSGMVGNRETGGNPEIICHWNVSADHTLLHCYFEVSKYMAHCLNFSNTFEMGKNGSNSSLLSTAKYR